MALFDQFGPAQANNGQAAPSPQATSGAPGFPFGSWGNQPPNMAGGLQQFLAARGMAQPQPGAIQSGTMGGPQTGLMQPGMQNPQPGMIGAPGSPAAPAPAMPGAPAAPAPAAVMPQGASATSPTGNFASQMQPFLGARR